MPRVGIEQYEILEEPSSTASAGTSDIKTVRPTSGRANAVLITVEGVAARVTFGGTSPGVGTGPGVVIPFGTAPLIYAFAFVPGQQSGPVIKFASNTAGVSTMSAIFLK